MNGYIYIYIYIYIYRGKDILDTCKCMFIRIYFSFITSGFIAFRNKIDFLIYVLTFGSRY